MSRILNLRLTPGQDLRRELASFCERENLEAASVVSAVGSLKEAYLRFAGAKEGEKQKGPFEIVSLSGTLSKHGLHLHVALSDRTGRVMGGHLMDQCLIYTTCELVILAQDGVRFTRVMDQGTGYQELQIEKI